MVPLFFRDNEARLQRIQLYSGVNVHPLALAFLHTQPHAVQADRYLAKKEKYFPNHRQHEYY